MPQLNQELTHTYRILEEIGSGGGGTVYKAYHNNLRKEVVLKKIHSNLLESNIRAEVDILKNLKSPYLPQVFDFLETGGEVYTVMDYIPGKSLKEVLEETNVFSQSRVVKWLDQLCQAVEQLHTLEPPIIHGDIKPANIMLTPKDDICLIDFNISGDFREEDIIGFTPGYAAPEQIESAAFRYASQRAAAPAKAAAPQQTGKERLDGGTIALGFGEGKPDGETVALQFGADKSDGGTIALGFGEGKPDGETVALGFGEGKPDGETVALGFGESRSDGGTVALGFGADKSDGETVALGFGEGKPDGETVALQPGSGQPAAAGAASARTADRVELPRLHVDARSDIYSIGATAYHLLTGKRPDKETIVPVAELNPRIEDSLAFLVMKCLSRDPDGRYQSIQELHKAVLNVHKSSAAYKGLLRRQLFARLLLMAGFVGCAALAGFGSIRMRQEKRDAYEELVALEQEARERQDYGQVEDYYRQAIGLYADGAEAAFEMEQALYQQKDYQGTIDFVEESVLPVVMDEAVMGNVYYLYGNSFFELERYADAAEALRQAIFYDAGNPRFYCDLAVALARQGNSKEAETQLEQAVGYHLESDSVYYTQGEIYNAQGEWQKAIDSFRSCIDGTEDEYLKMRSYIMSNNVMKESGSDLGTRQQLLEEARQTLSAEYQNAILEELAQVYIDLSNETGDAQYDMQAIGLFQEAVNYGWGTYNTYNNIALLYQKNQMYEEEAQILQTMLDQYGDQYNTYKRLAFMEAAAQNLKSNEERSYQAFAEYYGQAVSLYEEQLNNNQTDPEMNALQQLYEQAVAGGWIEE